MAKYVCQVCGYVHEGDAAPESCPVCKAPAEKFTVVEEGEKTWAAEHVVGVAKGVPEDIVKDLRGTVISEQRLAEIFLELQEKGAANINLVTPTHFVPSIRESIILSKKNGLAVPIVYNTGSYESVDTIKSLEGLVDIYLPDLKYVSSELSKKYSKVPDYFEVARKAIGEMVRQTGTPEFDDDGIMKKGVIVRHLLLPGCLSDSKNVIKYLYDTYRDDIFISIMNQYTPMEGIGDKYPELNRKVRKKEYDRLVDYAIDIGVTNGFIQEGGTAKESFIPEFTEEGI